ncbi:MAG: hypothetical protein COA71_14780 [SAR86 cluster bacterium]|uniref:Uncharacterized protein n=1 Tax=SAR86 cluster bacterium TaxID=2030880 RepID=A0A2A5C5D1_9GAMM|nr:MAG: hypothetical protein COA71_14780 [SAR86 cluster bacterium]
MKATLSTYDTKLDELKKNTLEQLSSHQHLLKSHATDPDVPWEIKNCIHFCLGALAECGMLEHD